MRGLALFFALSAVGFAQLDTNVITVAASRQLNVQPDQVTMFVTVTTNQDRTLDNVLAALPPIITAANFTGVSGYGTGHVQWAFSLTVPITNLTGMLALLHTAASQRAYTIDYFVQGSSASAQAAAAQQCPYPALIADARAQAGKLASAAGVTLGPIVSLVQGGADGSAPAVLYGSVYEVLAPGQIYGSASSFLNLLTTPRANSCALTVQFSLTH
jgi:uncharacterized protein YggE